MQRFFPLILVLLIGCDDKERTQALATTSKVEKARFSFEVENLDQSGKKVRIVLHNEGPFVHALPMAPGRLESQVKKETWLLLTSGAFSVPDLQNINVAVAVINGYCGRIQLGVRPFLAYDEIRAWFPEYGGESASPLWVVLRDGKVLAWHAGLLQEKELVDFINEALGIKE